LKNRTARREDRTDKEHSRGNGWEAEASFENSLLAEGMGGLAPVQPLPGPFPAQLFLPIQPCNSHRGPLLLSPFFTVRSG
jgi:hypothetical protein